MMRFTLRFILSAAVLWVMGLSSGANAQDGGSLPEAMLGVWDVSQTSCDRGITNSWLQVSPRKLDFYYGYADVLDVEQIGPVVFVRADLLELEGVIEPEVVTAYYRLEQPKGADQLRFKLKDFEPVDLIRCEVQD